MAEIIVGKDLGLLKLENPLDFAANPHIRPVSDLVEILNNKMSC